MQNPTLTKTYQPAAPMPAARNNRTALKWIAAICGLLFAGVIGLLVFALIGLDIFSEGGQGGPVALIVGLLCATLPVPIYVALVLWLDRYEAEPLWLLAMAFLWGATIAAFLAFLLNTILQIIVTKVGGADIGRFFGLVISAPLVEETAKGTVLFVLFFWKKDEFDGILDGIVYASMVALGFAMTENIKYYGEAALGGTGVFTVTFILRGAMSPFAHPLFTSMTGIGLGWSRQSDNKLIKYVMPPLGLLTAMMLHSTWNFSAYMAKESGYIFLGIYFLLMVPAFITALVVVVFALRGEGKIMRDYLNCDVQTGMLSPFEYDQMCRISGRMKYSFGALRTGGFSHWRARKQINQLTSELAFHRRRVARGFYPTREQAVNIEKDYINQLSELRRSLGGAGV